MYETTLRTSTDGTASHLSPAAYTQRHEGRILSAENGFLLGNGDLSVSAYQDESSLIFRFGKGDVWDRRLDLSDDPRPAHIDELRRGIREEGWRVGTIGQNLVAAKPPRDEARMREICQGSPMSYEQRPYPCPKPVGELRLHLPSDLMNLSIAQELRHDENRLDIRCMQDDVFDLRITCWVDDARNAFFADWTLDAGDAANFGRGAGIWFSLYRWADARVEDFRARQYAAFRTGLVTGAVDPTKASPMMPPSVESVEGRLSVCQVLPGERTFPQGFICRMTPIADGDATIEVPMYPQADVAALHVIPGDGARGVLAVAVTTTLDAQRVKPEGATEAADAPQETPSDLPALCALIAALSPDLRAAADASRAAVAAISRAFWARSSFACAEPLLTALWHDSLHAARCAYRPDRVPPGLFFPSTVGDYAHWHGDYHSNYNFQMPFIGAVPSNHPELIDSYHDGMRFFLSIGRRIARECYDARGAFVQLSAFPIDAENDPIGVVPLGRMVYMTGWAVNLYWARYEATRDADWLRDVAYEPIRDCALFLTDFLELGDDGMYHAFPSNQGEDAYTGDPADLTDVPEVAAHLCHALRVAIRAADALGVDAELRAEWADRLARYAADPVARAASDIERHRLEHNPPEYGDANYRERWGDLSRPWPDPDNYVMRWYFGHYPLMLIKLLHIGQNDVERNYPMLLRNLSRWMHPNGLPWAMSTQNYGRIGAWTESLGMLGALHEMLMQSWDGEIRLFPALPRTVDAAFETFRANGAFLVSARQSGGEVRDVRIASEVGGTCCLASPWGDDGYRVTDGAGRVVEVGRDALGRKCFETAAGGAYRIERVER